MANYIPPPSTNIPFRFTTSGYSKPSFSPLEFKFSTYLPRDLNAAINVMTMAPLEPPYLTETYTYSKGCPTYVLGYRATGIQILKGRCLYGGIRDFQISINGVDYFHDEVDLPALIKGLVLVELQLSASISGFSAIDLAAVLGGTHNPVSLAAHLNVFSRSLTGLSAYIHAWHERFLSAGINSMNFYDLIVSITSVPFIDLSGYLKVWPQQDLPVYARGWGAEDLHAAISQIYFLNLSANLDVVNDTNKNLTVILKGVGNGQKDLLGYVRGFFVSDLPALIRATYFGNFSAYLFPIQPEYLRASIMAWHQRFLPADINVESYPWNLQASIYSSGGWASFFSSIYPMLQTGVQRNLSASINSWFIRDLPATIFGDLANVLTAYINSVGHSSDLHASIRPKMIRLTTIIKVPTMEHLDLFAAINSSCFSSGYSNLAGSIYTMYKSELSAYIRTISEYQTKSLPANIGYSNSYSSVDKLKLSIIISPSQYIVEDKYKLLFNFYMAGSLLNAAITGILRAKDLTASIYGEFGDDLYYEELLKNREKVVSMTYGGIFKSYEVVEMAFKSVVKDYYYSSDGDQAWKSDRLERWMLGVRSFIPANISLNIKRKLHKATTLYDLRKFSRIDDAIRHAINYVTSYPTIDLYASIFSRGAGRNLTANIEPLYEKSSNNFLPCSITPVNATIVLSSNNSITKV